jgi:hypothetical protein
LAKKAFVYDGTNWIDIAQSTIDLSTYQKSNRTGLQIVVPTGATNGTVSANGAVTIGSAVANVTVSGAFNTTYENYLVLISGGATSASNTFLQMQLGSAITGYYEVRPRWSIAGAASVFTSNNASVFYTGMGTPNGLKMSTTLMSPFIAKNTTHESGMVNFTTSNIDFSYGYLNDTNSYTSFSITPTSGGTITGGTIRIYGYNNGL